MKSADIEKKWQKRWAEGQAFKAEAKSQKPKYYALDMFPYPSGSGLHVGHMASYMPSDIVSRYKRARGFNVLHPMGWDAFGLPAEQYAIQTGIHPAVTTDKAIGSFRSTLQSFGFSFDWSREISTCDPKYYKWTQFIFTKLFEKGLAYQKEVPVNWCPALRTVLANEEVVDGKSERGGHPVVRMPMKQWMLKITDYAERLLEGLDKIDWPDRTKEGQRNWIGKSVGALVRFKLDGHGDELEIFTTRPDTLFGVTFMVMAPEHPLVAKLTSPDRKSAVEAYQKATAGKLEVDRKAATDKTGVATGGHAVHPLTGEKIPVWIADYVMMDYGTGAIMAVPGHDERDFEFARKFHLPVKRVLIAEGENAGTPLESAMTGEGRLVNSEFLDGLSKTEAVARMNRHLEKEKLGRPEVQYKLRDWLFSRQRYWGEPFPVVHFPKKGLRTVPVEELPVLLPEVAEYEPSEKGEAPLARNADWVRYVDKDGEEGRRETDTMPGSAGSSWYFLRYTDPHNDREPFSQEAQKYWMPVDLYVGGPEHTVGHLLYARFWHKVLFDVGLTSTDEPIQKLAHQGMILGADGEKMSKSRGNVVPADSIRDEVGADAVRTFICFLGPLDKDKPWSPTGIEGVRRFLDRITRLVVNDEGVLAADDTAVPEDVRRLLHKTIKKVTDDIENMSFNTAISAMMIYVNELYRTETRSKEALRPLAQLLMPFAPHLAEELWEKMGGQGFVSLAPWPQYDNSLLADEKVTLGVQVNGKMRGTIQIAPDAPEETAVAAAQAETAIAPHLAGLSIAKVIYKAGRILNLIVK
ncbi:MAG: leucine--tRNA ligase [Bdellovibrionaceae bacterium]|nr:leucine--tRNA ligase [Pseudobdellovibrionaceae bacterium]